MGIRNTLGALISRPAAKVVESPIREMIEEVLATRSFVRPGEVAALRREIDALRSSTGSAEPDDRVAALETEMAGLRKKLNMAMGAIQAATAQLADARRAADEALGVAQRAAQAATTASNTAEAAADGVTGVEEQVEALRVHLAGSGAPGSAAALAVLEGTVGEIKSAIEGGAHDAHLTALLAAERDGKARKGALQAIEGRQQVVAAT